MPEEQPNIQPGTPPERPIFNPETLKEEIAGTDKKIDTLNETLETIKKAKKEALEDIKADITKAYPGDTEEVKTKRTQEYAAVKKMLDRLEKSYLQTAKEGLYGFEDIANMYFKELQTIAGDTNPEEGNIDLSTVDPYVFWKESAGWYEKAPQDFKEEKIEEESTRWQDAVYSFQEGTSNKIKEGEEENFQNWIEAHREDLRRVILKQTADRKYIIDFTNLSKNFTGAMADNVRAADFIAKNIGLADLFADVSQAITVWKGDKLYTGTLNKDFNRKNGLKGGYLCNKKYLEIWHGAVVSTNPDDQIAEDKKDFLPVDMFEAPKEGEKETEEASKKDEPEILQPKGDQVVKLVYKPGVDENDTPNENLKVIMKENAEKRQKGESFKLDYSYEELYEVGTIKKQGETTFELNTKDPDYSNVNNEIVYTSKEFPNIEIVIPFSKNSGYLLRVKTQRNNTEEKKVVVYEFADIESMKAQLGKEAENQQKSPKSDLPKEEIETMELSDTCSAEVTKSQIKKAKERYENIAKIVVKGEVPTELEPQNKDEKTKVTIKNSELTEEGTKKIPVDEKVTEVNIETGENLSKESLDVVLSKTPNATKLSLKGAKDLYKDSLFTVASRLNKTLEDLDLSYSAVKPEELQYLDSCTKLKKLNLSYTVIDDYAVKTYISKLASLEDLNLSNTNVTDENLGDLAKLEKLTFLDLRGTDTSFEATMELKRKLPGCKIKISEQAEKELDKLLKEKIEELIKKHESKIKEDIKEILDCASDEDVSIQNTKPDYDKKSITADIYFENQKITSVDLTIKITGEDNGEISPEKLYEQLFISKNLDTEPETEEASNNKLKHKVTIGEKVIYIEKKYEFTDKEEAIKEKIKNLKKEKTEKECAENLYKDPSTIARKEIEKLFAGKDTDISFKKTEILRAKKTIRGKLSYKKEVIGLMDIEIIDAEKKTTAALLRDDNGGMVDINFVLTKINDIEKAEEEESDKKARTDELALALKTINGNLEVNNLWDLDEQGKRMIYPIKYFGEEIGYVEIGLETPLKDQPNEDISIEDREDNVDDSNEGLKTKIEKLISEVLEKRKEEKLKEFEQIVRKVIEMKTKDKSIFVHYSIGLDTKNAVISEADNTKKPYVKTKITAITTLNSADMPEPDITEISIEDWLAGESEIYIRGEKIEREKVEEKIASLF